LYSKIENKRTNKAIILKANDLKAGIYFCVLKTDEGVQIRKMINVD